MYLFLFKEFQARTAKIKYTFYFHTNDNELVNLTILTKIIFLTNKNNENNF